MKWIYNKYERAQITFTIQKLILKEDTTYVELDINNCQSYFTIYKCPLYARLSAVCISRIVSSFAHTFCSKGISQTCL
jgi:hypothetical protein